MTIGKPKRPKLPAWCLKISISSRVWILVCNAVIHRTKVIFILSYDWGVGTDEPSSLSISSFPIQSICSNQFSLMSELGPVRRILLPNIEHVEICVIAIRIRQCIMTAGNEERNRSSRKPFPDADSSSSRLAGWPLIWEVDRDSNF